MDYDYNEKRIGGCIITICVLHFIALAIYLLALVGSFLAKEQLAELGFKQSTYIILAVISITICTGAILILRKLKLGIAIYYVGILASLINSIIMDGLKLSVIVGLILPILMAIFINSKKELFGFGNN